ncbi:TetR/AcrR family transcriptional regulator [Rhizobium sp. WYJ-E13]|uniref:TetR/AcrR family transcriptional regulator n=1 Tax=Rhizobium sp. WYJ-E13 TaxID=2849093 RepID=UPI001C1ECAEC|nr:TetR/AcrR family transcriptional regulator [Rhizobium sp. WYJ-E13]QWW67093.1 TetR/AcrR family transcriptional regulator [Rhizobium sp. WYJ-E13]
MSSVDNRHNSTTARPRRRLSREERHRQLLDVSWRLIREEGTDALTLGRLAEQAGVAKPIVYDHFGTRPGLLAELYREFDDRQTALMNTALRESGQALSDKAKVMATSYIDCVLTQGREIPDVIAALASSPELEKVKHECQVVFMNQCRSVLTPFVGAGTIASASLWAMLGAAETLSYAAATGEITATQAESELFEIILGMVSRSTC